MPKRKNLKRVQVRAFLGTGLFGARVSSPLFNLVLRRILGIRFFYFHKEIIREALRRD